jgi:hypothetical protein
MSHWKFLVLLALVLAMGAACEVLKTENPLAPTVAGPIPGVAITAPGISQPAEGTRIPVDSQPLSLMVANASTNGVRPLSYRFEVAADKNFNNVVFERDAVPPDASGKTAVKLPSPLAPERGYYWRAKAYDGANTGDYSATVFFEVYTPVVLGAPQPYEPEGTASSIQPRFSFANAPRTGPAGPISYNIQLSTSGSFGSLTGNWFLGEEPSVSHFSSPIALPYSTQYYWRVRAREATAGDGPWSGTQSFRTPAPAPTPVPGGSCGPPYAPTPLGIVECQRSKYGTPMGASNTVAMLRGVAHDLNASGVAGSGPFGILVKTGGSNCGGYSCDIICVGNGNGQQQYDVLGDAEGAAIPVWSGPNTVPNITVRTCEVVP